MSNTQFIYLMVAMYIILALVFMIGFLIFAFADLHSQKREKKRIRDIIEQYEVRKAKPNDVNPKSESENHHE